MWDEDQIKLIKQVAQELSLASHQAKDSELSDFFADLQKRMKGSFEKMHKDLEKRTECLERDMKEVTELLRDIRHALIKIVDHS